VYCLSRKAEKNHEKTKSRLPVTVPRFEVGALK
jgi:hypothetical protein